MALNRELVGKSFPGTEPVVVDAGKVRAYALATQTDNPRYVDLQRPDGVVAPPIYGVVVSQPAVERLLLDPELGVDTDRLLHDDELIRFSGVMRAGEQLRYESVVIGVGDKRGGETLDIASRVRRADGSLVYDSLVGLLIRREGVRATGQDRRVDLDGVPRRGEPPAIATGVRPLLERIIRVEADQSLRYADASGDYNPIHKDAAFARSVGLPGIILHGMCTLAMVQNAIVDGLADGDPARLRTLGARFARSVLPNDTLTLRFFAAPGDGAGLRVAFDVVNQRGKVVIKDGAAEIAR